MYLSESIFGELRYLAVLCPRAIMSFTAVDLLVISLTVNWCTLCFNVIQVLRNLILGSNRFRNWKLVRTICECYAPKPWLMAKVLTEQILVWTLSLASIAAVCSTDVIKKPFRNKMDYKTSIFIDIVFGVNIGKYVFLLVQNCFLSRYMDKIRFRAECMHHMIAVLCYTLFLAYKQNVLLGLIGAVMESNTITNEISKLIKEMGQRDSIHYKRTAFVHCVSTFVFRGVLPIIFLAIAMFHQTPFAMDYAPITVFFLSIIFFSVINVWLILTSIQRLLQLLCLRSISMYNIQPQQSGDTSYQHRTHLPQSTRNTGLHVAKNNLGYVRPYENKNFFNNLSEQDKLNLNNRKEFPKETFDQVATNSTVQESKDLLQTLQVDTFSIGSDDSASRNLATGGGGNFVVNYHVHRPPLRISDSTDSTTSGTVLISRQSNNSSSSVSSTQDANNIAVTAVELSLTCIPDKTS